MTGLVVGQAGRYVGAAFVGGSLTDSGGRTGSMAATESGTDNAAVAGDVPISGVFVTAESGSDVSNIGGDVLVAGDFNVIESGTDIAALIGDILIEGILAASEVGSDAFSGVGFVGSESGGVLHMHATVIGANRLKIR